MNINKKLSRARQWADEKMGAQAKTGVSDEFKNLETEMQLRHDGMQNLHKSTTQYIKSLSKNTSGEDKERVLPVAKLGQTMANHGDEFDPDSEFGNCLIGFGRAQERIARHQDTFVSKATNGWLEGLDRTLVDMKEYQNARKKLDSRRLAYDTSLSKLQKSKRDDFRAEEELRSQKAKYEESSEDVFRRMQDIKEAEDESVDDLTNLLDTELEYFEKCAEELRRLKAQWPAQQKRNQANTGSRTGRPRSNTAHSYKDRFQTEIPEEPVRPTIRSTSTARSVSNSYLQPQPQHSSSSSYYESQNTSPARPYISRSQTAQMPIRDRTPSGQGRMPFPPVERKHSFANDAAQGNFRSFLRPTSTSRIQTQDSHASGHSNSQGQNGGNGNGQANNVFQDPSDESTANSATSDRSPGGYSYGGRSASPATSQGSAGHGSVGHGSVISRQASYNNLLQGQSGNANANGGQNGGQVLKKGPPPPPPSRSKKPAPPPPPGLPGKRGDMMA